MYATPGKGYRTDEKVLLFPVLRPDPGNALLRRRFRERFFRRPRRRGAKTEKRAHAGSLTYTPPLTVPATIPRANHSTGSLLIFPRYGHTFLPNIMKSPPANTNSPFIWTTRF